MDKHLNRQCYLCGGKKLSILKDKVRDSDEISVLECEFCGLIFLSTFEHVNQEFYAKSTMHEDDSAFLDPEYWRKELDRDVERRLQYVKLLIQNKTLLDFGCGEGDFLLRASNIAQKVFGIEIEKKLHSHYKKNRLTVFQNIEKFERNKSYTKLDVITLFHVLEHLPDPIYWIQRLAEHLKDGGQMLIEVPSANDALLTLYKNEAYAKFTYWSCHLYLFTPVNLSQLAKKAGLVVNYVKQIQRYPLSNHLHWLSNGEPGGHQKWSFLNEDILNFAYEQQLASIGQCDTIIASLSTP